MVTTIMNLRRFRLAKAALAEQYGMRWRGPTNIMGALLNGRAYGSRFALSTERGSLSIINGETAWHHGDGNAYPLRGLTAERKGLWVTICPEY